jgi:hypothetical protein
LHEWFFEMAGETDKQDGTKGTDCLEVDKKILRCSTAEEVFTVCEYNGDGFNHTNISTAMYRLAKYLGSFSEIRMKGHMGLTYRQEKICRKIFQRAVSIAEQFEPHSISTLVWALGSLNMPSQQLASGIGAILKRAAATIEDFKPIDLADFIWGLAIMGLPPGGKLASAISDHALKLMDKFNAQHISKFMWGFAKLQLETSTDLVKSVAKRALETINDFRPPNMSQTMWAFAKLERFPGVELGQAMLKRAKATLDAFLRQTQCSANFLWALDKLGIDPDPQVADVLAGRQKSLSNLQTVSDNDRSSGQHSRYHDSSRLRPGSDLPPDKSGPDSNRPRETRKWVKLEGERDYNPSKHDVDFKRKRDSESCIHQEDEIYRPIKRQSGEEIGQRTLGRPQEGAFLHVLDSGFPGKAPWLGDSGMFFFPGS